MRLKMFLRCFSSSIILYVLSVQNIAAQGCSDAGFCTLGNLKEHTQQDSTIKNKKITLLTPFGLGDESVLVFTPAIQYDQNFSEKWAIQAKITGNYASGNLGAVAGLGDVYLNGIFNTKINKTWKSSIAMGLKVPFNYSGLNASNDFPLPMQYQSSLGTFDYILSLSFSTAKWLFAAGYQQPFSGINLNKFTADYWKSTNQYEDAKKYPDTRDFNRRGDVLTKAAYNFKLNAKFKCNAGLLAIYHLGKDTYIDASKSNLPIEIDGSEGLTLNATLSVWYQINNRFQLGLISGKPLLVREVRPDGLTRSFIISPEISFTF
jgi:hypothetical protein